MFLPHCCLVITKELDIQNYCSVNIFFYTYLKSTEYVGLILDKYEINFTYPGNLEQFSVYEQHFMLSRILLYCKSVT